MNLKSNNYNLRLFNQDDLENVFRGLSDPTVILYYGVSFDSLEATQEQINWYAKIESENTGRWRAICSSTDNSFLGAVGLNDWDQETGVAQIGYWLLPEYWGKGVLKETFPIFLDFAFNHLKIKKIEAEVETLNVSSRKLLESSGFTYEKTLKDCEMKYGKLISLDIFSKTR